jgi:hypothetical protein
MKTYWKFPCTLPSPFFSCSGAGMDRFETCLAIGRGTIAPCALCYATLSIYSTVFINNFFYSITVFTKQLGRFR